MDNNSENKVLVEFTDLEYAEILRYMESEKIETVQEAVLDAIRRVAW